MAIRVITGTVRLSYAWVWEPKSIQGGDPRYTCKLLILKTDQETVTRLMDAEAEAEKAGIAKFGASWASKKNSKLIKDGDLEDDVSCHGHYVINTGNKNKPYVIDRKMQPIMDTTELYSGCYARVSLDIFPFNNKIKGVTSQLNGLQKMSDGEPLGGMSRSKPEDDFSVVEDDDFLN